MKKNKLLLVASSLVLCGGAITSCNSKEASKAKTYKVAFVENYQGGKTTFVDVEEGKKVAEPATPTRSDGATFEAWRIGSDPTSTRFDFEIPIYQDCVFYASWIKKYEPTTKVDELTFKRALAGCALGHATATFNRCEFNNNDFNYSNNASTANTIYKSLVIKNDGKIEHIKGVKLDPATKKTSDVEFYNQYDDVRQEYHTVYNTEAVYGDYYQYIKNPRTYIRSIESSSISKFTTLISSFLYSDYYELNYNLFSYNTDTKMYETTIGSVVDGSFKIKFEDGFVTKLIFKVTDRFTLRTLLDVDVDFSDIDKTKIDFPKSMDIKIFDFANKLDSSYEYTPSKTSVILYDDIYSSDTEMKFTPSIYLNKIMKTTGGIAPLPEEIIMPITNSDDLNYLLVGAYKDEELEQPLTIDGNTIKGLDSITAGSKIYVLTAIGINNTGAVEFTKSSNARTTTSTFAFKGSSDLSKDIDASKKEGLYTNKTFSHSYLKTIIEENIDLGNGFDLNQVLFNFSSTTEGVSFSYDYDNGGKKLGNYPDIVLNLNSSVKNFDVKINIEIGYSGAAKTLTLNFQNANTYYNADCIKYVGQAPSTLEYTLNESKAFVGTQAPAVVEKIMDFYDHDSTNQNIAVKLENNDRNIVAKLEDGNIVFTTSTIYEGFGKIEGLTLFIGVTENNAFKPLDFIYVNISEAQ